MTENASSQKKDVQKLQRAIVDGLEDVKAQDLRVFDTEHLSSLFERVIIASGASNRQTKALAASVRDKVREAGFPKPRIEGEDNGEWIIVDCGAAVAHVMQPAIRQYYNLEEIWGEKPVRLKLGAAKPAPAKAAGDKGGSAKPAGTDKKLTTLRASKTPISDRKSANASVKQSVPAIKNKVDAKAPVARKAPAKRAVATKVVVNAPAAKPVAAKKAATRKPATQAVSKAAPKAASAARKKPAGKT
ncbi:MAG: ribosome silencing factor [Burkholderiaceae bacterium]|nr:ribosome silencing factor [Burkholderiaceae bacterium]